MKIVTLLVLFLWAGVVKGEEQPTIQFEKLDHTKLLNLKYLDPELFRFSYYLDAKGFSEGEYEVLIGSKGQTLEKLNDFTAQKDGKLYLKNGESLCKTLFELTHLAPGEAYEVQVFKKNFSSKEPFCHDEVIPNPIRSSGKGKMAISLVIMDPLRSLYELRFENFPKGKTIAVEVKCENEVKYYSQTENPASQVLIQMQKEGLLGGKGSVTVFHEDLDRPLVLLFDWGFDQSFIKLLQKFIEYSESQK